MSVAGETGADLTDVTDLIDPTSAPAGSAPPAGEASIGGATPRWVRWSRSGPVLALPGVLALVALASWGINRDAWLDEAFSIAATHQLAETYDRTAYTMATYYAQLSAWTVPSSELWWVRMLSVVHAAAAVMVVGTVAVRSFGRRVALWATLFMGCSWMVVKYAHEARSFAFVVLLVSLGWLATDHLVEKPAQARWIACHVVVGVLAPLTHGMAAFALVWQAVAVLVSGAGRRTWYSTLPGWAAAVTGTALLYRAGGSDLGTPASPTDLEFLRSFLERFHGGVSVRDPAVEPWLVLFAFTIVGSLMCVPRLLRAQRGLDRFRLVMAPAWGLGTLVGIVALNVVRPGVHVRYAIGAAPGLALIWALTAEQLRVWFLARRALPLRLAGRGSLAAVVVLVVLLAGQHRYHQRFPSDWTQLVNHIARESRAGDGVAVPNTNRVPFDVAWSRLDDPPDLLSVAAVQPLGTVRRFDTYPGAPNVHYQLFFAERVWLIERHVGAQSGGFKAFVDDFVTHGGFEEVGSWTYGEARLHLAVKRSDPPPG